MLLRFSVSNFGSLRDKQELSMIASHAIKDDPSGLIDAPELRKERVLPAAVIYGANASGKSNFVKALAQMQMLVRDSHRKGEPGGGVPMKPFLLDPAYAKAPSEFSIDFIWNGARHLYSFEAHATEFLTESLHVWHGGPRTMLFERKGTEFEFGRSLKGENRVIEKLTRQNSLFLSAAAQNNHEALSEIAAYFGSILIEQPDARSARDVARALATERIDERMIKLLSSIDIGASGIRITEPEHKFQVNIDDVTIKDEHNDETAGQSNKLEGSEIRNESPSTLSRHMAEMIKTTFLNYDWGLKQTRFAQLERRATNGQSVYLDFKDESAGTVQLLSMLGPIFRALDEGRVVVIDEFASRLHTRAAEIILSLFNSKQTNPKGAQLIVATHDTNLLNAKGLRRDQVWFTEKGGGGATHLYPLTDIETRKGDNLEKGYLQGRYGAIPFAGPLADFVKAD